MPLRTIPTAAAAATGPVYLYVRIFAGISRWAGGLCLVHFAGILRIYDRAKSLGITTFTRANH